MLWLLWTVISLFDGGNRVSEPEEIKGLDIVEHCLESDPHVASTK